MMTYSERAIDRLVDDPDYIEWLVKWRNREIDWEKCDHEMRIMEDEEEIVIRRGDKEPDAMDARKERSA